VIDLCTSCKKYRELVIVEENTNIGYCETCAEILPPSIEEQSIAFLLLTIPFTVGEQVECRTAGQLYDGIGIVEEISFDLKNGGTPVYPAFRVRFEDKAYPEVPDELWYTEICLMHCEKPVLSS